MESCIPDYPGLKPMGMLSVYANNGNLGTSGGLIYVDEGLAFAGAAVDFDRSLEAEKLMLGGFRKGGGKIHMAFLKLSDSERMVDIAYLMEKEGGELPGVYHGHWMPVDRRESFLAGFGNDCGAGVLQLERIRRAANPRMENAVIRLFENPGEHKGQYHEHHSP